MANLIVSSHTNDQGLEIYVSEDGKQSGHSTRGLARLTRTGHPTVIRYFKKKGCIPVTAKVKTVSGFQEINFYSAPDCDQYIFYCAYEAKLLSKDVMNWNKELVKGVTASGPTDWNLSSASIREQKSRKRPPRRREKVYLISDGMYYKIGKSKNVAERLKNLQTSNARKLELIATVSTAVYSEAQAHKDFDAYRVNGEWFKMSPVILKKFKELGG